MSQIIKNILKANIDDGILNVEFKVVSDNMLICIHIKTVRFKLKPHINGNNINLTVWGKNCK